MTRPQLIEEVVSYIAHANLWHRMRPLSTAVELNDLMVGMLESEGRILGHFGLPATLEFNTPIQFLALKEDFEFGDISVMLDQLEQLAVHYHASPVLTDIALLEKAQREQMSIENVLPALRFPMLADDYFDDLYHNHFLTGLLRPEDFLIKLRQTAIKGIVHDTDDQ